MSRCFSLDIADGTAWNISAEGSYSSFILSLTGSVARLPSGPGPSTSRRLLLRDEDSGRTSNRFGDDAVLRLKPGDRDSLRFDVMRVLLAVARFSIERGGLLLHSGLAVRDGQGILLGGRSGAGKSTAAGRLSYPWQALCDDITLVVPDAKGNYFAHPLPTWGRILTAEPPEFWHVSRAVPLGAAFLLEQSLEDRAVAVGSGEGVCLLNEISDQAVWPLTEEMGEAERRSFRLGLFNNLVRFTETVPAFKLRFTRLGAFWREIELVVTPVDHLAEFSL